MEKNSKKQMKKTGKKKTSSRSRSKRNSATSIRTPASSTNGSGGSEPVANSENERKSKTARNSKGGNNSGKNSSSFPPSNRNGGKSRQSASATRDSKNGDGEQPRVLAIDIGGTKVKMLLTGELEARKAPSGLELTPLSLVSIVNELTSDWEYDAITMGFPGLVGECGPLAEPGNLGPGWVGFDFVGAFGKPTKILNDAAMQAVGSYEGGRMLFIGLGTGVGSTLIVDHTIIPLELGGLRWNARRTVGELLSKRYIKKLGVKKWRSAVYDIVHSLMAAFIADYVVVGGGNAKLLKLLPPGARLGHNQTAFRGGYRVWGVDSYSSEDLEAKEESEESG